MKKNFFDEVYEMVRKIPRGRVTSYGQVARLLGNPRASRAVGWALRALPRGSDVPWHRVVNRKGAIRLGDRHRDLQRALLESEGVIFTPAGTVDLELHLWKPDLSCR